MLTQRFSWGEYLDHVAVKSETGDQDLHSRSNSASSYWDLGAGFEGAMKLALHGWPEGAATVQKVSAKLFDRISSQVEREYPVYDTEGQGIDVSRFLDGEPECWQRMETRITEGQGRRIYRLVFNMTASCGVDASVMLAKGAAVVALCELLEFSGHGVEINAVLANFSCVEQHVRIKDSDQPLDLPRVAFAIAHPAMFRRLGFSMLELLDGATRSKLGVTSHGGYGRVAEAQKSEQGDIYIGGSVYGERQWTSMEASAQWVVDQLKKQGIHLDEEAS